MVKETLSDGNSLSPLHIFPFKLDQKSTLNIQLKGEITQALNVIWKIK